MKLQDLLTALGNRHFWRCCYHNCSIVGRPEGKSLVQEFKGDALPFFRLICHLRSCIAPIKLVFFILISSPICSLSSSVSLTLLNIFCGVLLST